LHAVVRDHQIADRDLTDTQCHDSAQIHFEHQSVSGEFLGWIFL